MGAVRREEMKESGIGSLFSRLSSFFSSCLSWIRWQILMRRIDWIEFQYSRARKAHCEKGFHQLRKAGLSVSNGKRTFSVEYLRCCLCGYMFFSTAKDKRIYLRLTGSHRKAQREMFEKIFKTKKERI